MHMTRFDGKTALVTGAGTGMGRAVAERLAREGARVALAGRRAAPLEETAEAITAMDGQALVLPCDIAREESLLDARARCEGHWGAVDALFANAGALGGFAPFDATEAATLDDLVATNLRGTFLTLKHLRPRRDGGAIVINASWTAKGVMPGTSAYAATKGALLAMTRTLAVELGAGGIRVNAINPGIILTPMAADVLDPAFATRLSNHTPLGRNGTPEDVVGTVAWLLSDDAAFVTGQDIEIDGGYTLGGLRP